MSDFQGPLSVASPSIQRWSDHWKSRVGEERTIRARWLLNPDAEPQQNVQLTEQQGRIVDIRPLADATSRDILPLALIPPLVNAHTHLEFSDLPEPLQPALPFPDWIRSVIGRRQSAVSDPIDGIRRGLAESSNCGVQLIGEIAAHDEHPADQAPRLTVVRFREAIGLRADRIEQQLQSVQEFLSRSLSSSTPPTTLPQPAGIVRGISPHAPYTVHPELLHELMSLSVRHAAPVTMHLAETQDELELLTTGTGRFAEFLSGMGLFDRTTFPGGRSVLEFLQELSRAPRALAVHGNYFCEADIRFLAQTSSITTVYCPRTHQFFGHTQHPLPKLLKAGCRVILGTDSRASNPDLSIWKELQLVASQFSQLAPGRLLAMITTHAAEAMGQDPNNFHLRRGAAFSSTALCFRESIANAPEILRHPETTPFVL